MKPLGGKPKREYEMSEKERLLNQIRKASNDAENAKRDLRQTQQYANELVGQRDKFRQAYQMLDFLKRQEVFVADGEGMKYLTGEDLVEYCRDGLIKEDAERHAGYQTISLGQFIEPLNDVFDQVYAEHAERLTLTYKTKGRYK